jgi:hypothetical protein
VTVTYATAGGWSAPAACAWTCNTDYALDTGACINAKQVSCAVPASLPANATATPAHMPVTYTTAGGWTAPAACAWTCSATYHLNRAGDGCVPDETITDCLVSTGSVSGAPATPLTIVGSVQTAGTGAAGGSPSVLGKVCYGMSRALPPDLAMLTCVNAAYLQISATKGFDDDSAAVSFPGAGDYGYVYAFSGDGAEMWTTCDQNGIVDASTTSLGAGDAVIGP